jgi:hypothetical protein
MMSGDAKMWEGKNVALFARRLGVLLFAAYYKYMATGGRNQRGGAFEGRQKLLYSEIKEGGCGVYQGFVWAGL